MSALEKIVRPYQTRDVTPPRVPASSSPSEAPSDYAEDAITYKVGGNFTLHQFNGNETEAISYYMDRMHHEEPRQQDSGGENFGGGGGEEV